MSKQDLNSSDRLERKQALSRGDKENRSAQNGKDVDGPTSDDEVPMPKMGEAEMGALHIRVIALENLVIALLADASHRQIELSRDMARYIAPREGCTHHPLTIHAAAHIIDLVERSARFRSGELPRSDDND